MNAWTSIRFRFGLAAPQAELRGIFDVMNPQSLSSFWSRTDADVEFHPEPIVRQARCISLGLAIRASPTTSGAENVLRPGGRAGRPRAVWLHRAARRRPGRLFPGLANRRPD